MNQNSVSQSLGLPSQDPPVTVVISRRVKSGREAEFELFLKEVSAACGRFPGHLGTNIFRPSAAADREYRIIFKFNSQSDLQRWQNSEERRFWFAQAEELTEGPPVVQVLTGLETWFTLPGQSIVLPPPRYKMAIVSWLVVFPLLTCILAILGPALNALPLVARTAIVTAITIPTMTYLLMPRMTQWFSRWLYPLAAKPQAESPENSPPSPIFAQGESHLALPFIEQTADLEVL